MNPPEDRSKVVTPRQARRQFLASKRGSVKDSTGRAYKFPTRHFVEFCEKRGAESVSQIDGYIIETWKQARRTEDIKRVTLHNNVKHFRVFISWCERTDLVEHGTADRIKIPELYNGEDVGEDVLRLGQAEDMLRCLRTCAYGGRNHALFSDAVAHRLSNRWHAGARPR